MNIRLDTMGRQGDTLADVQEIEIWPYRQMVYVQHSACHRK